MRYRLRWGTHEAKRNFRALAGSLRQQVRAEIESLQDDPYPPYSEPLERELVGRRKIKIDGWRLVYRVYENDILVVILMIRPRDRRAYLNIP